LRVNFVQYDPAHLGTEPVLVALVFGQGLANRISDRPAA
jgi:hypothetical protein